VPDGANVLAYLALSVILGIISYVLFLLRPLVSFYLFEGGLLTGFAFMYATFENGMTGWSDLAGIMTFFFCVITGLVAGLLAQIIIYFVQKRKRR